jgi:hypothetical protein
MTKEQMPIKTKFPIRCTCCDIPQILFDKHSANYHKNKMPKRHKRTSSNSNLSNSNDNKPKKQKTINNNIGNSFFTDACTHIMVQSVISNNFSTENLHQIIMDKDFSDETKQIIKIEAERRLQEFNKQNNDLELSNSAFKNNINRSDQEKTFLSSLSKLTPATQPMLYGSSIPAHYEVNDEALKRLEEEFEGKLNAVRYEKSRREIFPRHLVYKFLIQRYSTPLMDSSSQESI